ncbi:MAG: glycosyltransferase family 39 protein [Phascolarctobacterium sp.]|nr:glycosyltransferase family 39 protein [Phascolarctobacterium sp.]
MRQIEKNSLLIIAGLVLFTIFFGIGGVPLLDPDEPVYAETAREMIQFSDYLSPRIFGNYWYDKPPMYYWLVALSQHIFGFTEFAARFPASLMACGTVIMLYVSTTTLFNEKAGFWSAVILTSCVQFFYMGKAAVTDTTLLFFMSGAILCFAHRKYWLMYICMALATVTKGPIGIVFPGAIIFIYLAMMGQLREILRMHVVRGTLLYFLVASPWYYAMYTVHGMQFIETFLGFHNVTRFTTPEHANRVTFWYYFPVIILGMFPWTGMLVQAVKASICESRIDDMRQLLLYHVWAGFVFIFFTICQTKLTSYILPMFPPMAVIIGWNVSRMLTKMRHNSTYYSWICGSGLMFLLLGIGWFVGANYLPEAAFSLYILGGLTLIIGFGAVFSLWYYRDIEMSCWLHTLVGLVTMCVAFAFVMPVIADRFSVKSMSAVYAEQCDKETPIYVDKFLRPGFMYYAGKAGVEMLPQTGALPEALRNGQHKYILVRGLEYRRVQKTKQVPTNVAVVKEISDIYLLEQK